MKEGQRKVAIIGSGIIGRAWAIIFSSADYQVRLYDSDRECLAQAPELIRNDLKDLCKRNLARGTLTLEQRMNLISTHESLEECLRDVHYVQENIVDNLKLKQELFGQIDQLLDQENKNAILCSSTSVHMPTLVFAEVQLHKSQCLVVHPVNPPLHVRLVELVPSVDTREDILDVTRSIMIEVGQKPVIQRREISGFALNRLQYAVFQEAFRLVHDEVMTPEDVDTVMTEGLGPRYAFMGPWMTAHLNANGCADYFNKYSEGIYNVSNDCQPILRIDGKAAQQVVDSMMAQVPLERIVEKRRWRDSCLIELAKLKDTRNLTEQKNSETNDYWRQRYERLQGDYDQLQLINQNLEDKLLKVVESYERKREELEADSEHVKSTLMADVNKLSSKLVDARIKLHDYEEKEILHASECGSPCHKAPISSASFSLRNKTSETTQKEMVYDPNLV